MAVRSTSSVPVENRELIHFEAGALHVLYPDRLDPKIQYRSFRRVSGKSLGISVESVK